MIVLFDSLVWFSWEDYSDARASKCAMCITRLMVTHLQKPFEGVCCAATAGSVKKTPVLHLPLV